MKTPMLMIRVLPLLLIISILAACSSYALATMPPPIAAFGPAPQDIAVVCVIRQSVFAQAVTFAIHDNGQLVGATKSDSYFCYLAQPGEHSISSDTGDSTDHVGYATLVVWPNQRYWLQQDHDNNFGSITSKLISIDEAHARELISSCEYKVVTEAPGHELLPPPVPLALARIQ